MAQPILDCSCSYIHLRLYIIPGDVVPLECTCQKFQSFSARQFLPLGLHFDLCRLPFRRTVPDEVEFDVVIISLKELIDHRQSDFVLLEPVIDSLSGETDKFGNVCYSQSCRSTARTPAMTGPITTTLLSEMRLTVRFM